MCCAAELHRRCLCRFLTQRWLLSLMRCGMDCALDCALDGAPPGGQAPVAAEAAAATVAEMPALK